MPFIENIKSKVDDAKTSKAVEEKQWDLNLKFLEGNQHLSFDKNLQSWLTVRDNNNLPTINMLLPLYRNLVSRLVAAYPGVVVMPASPSADDIVKAQSSEAALRYYWAEEDIAMIINEVVQWLVPCGNVLLHTYYDPAKGKICPEVIKPFDFFYERGIVETKDSRWVAIRRFYTKEDLIESYPDKRKEIEKYIAESNTETGDAGPATYVDGTSYYYANYVPPGKQEVFEVYDRKGNHGIVLGDVWLYEGETPMKVFPCQHIKWTELRNRVWGLSLLTPLLELQAYYNRARGQILQNTELMANPKWLIPKGAGVAPNAITKRAGEKIFYNPAGGTPQQVPAAPIPSYVIDNIRQLQSEIMDVSGVHGSTLGKRAVGILSGKAIQEMTASDLSTLQMTQNGIEKACQEMAKVVLVYMKAYYSEARMYKMIDRMGSVVFRSVSSQDIVDVPEIFIQANTLFQADAVDREARAIQLFQAGLIDKDQALQEIEFRTSNSWMIETLQGIAHANEMLDAVKRGAAIEVFATDDIEGFNKVFGEFIRSDEYYSLPQERQDYIRDVMIALASAKQQNPEQFAAELENRMKVFPRQRAATENIATVRSPMSQFQVAAEAANRVVYDKTAQAAEGMAEAPTNEAITSNAGAIR